MIDDLSSGLAVFISGQLIPGSGTRQGSPFPAVLC
jgi:hypothetical protein